MQVRYVFCGVGTEFLNVFFFYFEGLGQDIDWVCLGIGCSGEFSELRGR